MGAQKRVRAATLLTLLVLLVSRYSSMSPSLASAPFLLAAAPHTKRVPGFPLDALSMDPVTHTYYYDMEDAAAKSLFSYEGFKAFFRGILCQPFHG